MIDAPALANASDELTSGHALRYETLRRHLVEDHASAPRDGLVVLLRQGVAAWMNAWLRLPTVPARPSQAQDEHQRSSPLSDGASAEVVRILVAMTHGHIQEVRA